MQVFCVLERKTAKLPEKRLKILIDIGEGLGGLIISLNWVCYFYNKFCKGKEVDLDCSCFNKKILDNFVPRFVNKTLSPKTEKDLYDLKIFLVRCPQVVYANSENINLCTNACPIHCEFYHDDWLKECIKGTHAICMKSLTPTFVFSKIQDYLTALK